MQTQHASAYKSSEPSNDWQQWAHLGLPHAAKIAGVSTATLYRAQREGKLDFVRLAGRTLITAASFQRYLGSAEPWTKSDRGHAARTARRGSGAQQ